ncbi:acetyl esterase/lipase [Novosphingobium chloroacetimidivorans]|uniref:Acetyl esterase/lipase n=1 Tax=Novosphingobium chloroacetimidivorans TaxID=1428314 RepID=A0A7W7KDN0_9SPHN|nr:alpha/beta hydrolase [Novosphingobium chloroacetimidivorans]MBB4860308.1 acetyl esterase/lipase [Novosphingobium chloroacetimidivorans]
MTENKTAEADTAIGSIESDIVYAVHDGIELRGDFYRPSGAGPFPVVVAAPGGGWFVSDPRGLKSWGLHLARQGIAVFAVQYRAALAEKTFPGAVCDVLAAIQFVRASAARFAIDPERIGLMGSSAGAHVTALAALAGDSPRFQDRQPVGGHTGIETSVKAFAGIYGVYDMFAHWQHEITDFGKAGERRSECFIGVPPYEDRQLYFDASPISHVRRAANKLAVFLAYGTADHVVSPSTQSEAFRRALKQAGFPVAECPVVGAGHFWFSDEPIEEPGSHSGFIAPRLLRFFKRHL